ncbi:MAG TPA: efflux RND transporter periplasmic adaptor subunit [Aeromonadales bacterium]|nr:efflux RND transporter periplasmic adaptor subunit [Aeromonadales bacterium]
MKKITLNKRTITLLLVLIPLLVVFVYVATTSGPLKPILVTIEQVKKQSIKPSLFGIGVVAAEFQYRIGPSMTGRILALKANIGDKVTRGEVLGEMDPVDMDSKIHSMLAAIKRARASIVAAEAKVNDSSARVNYAQSQLKRYQKLAREKTVSKESEEVKYQEYLVSKASLDSAHASLLASREELTMIEADYRGLLEQRKNLKLLSPTNGLVVARYFEPGSTVLAGQAVLEIIAPESIWVDVRFNQLHSEGLKQGLESRIVLRSRASKTFSGKVSRIEPLADSVTEETLAKITFVQIPDPYPPIGELAEVTVIQPALPPALVIPNTGIKRYRGETGVWLINDDQIIFRKIVAGAYDLDGQVQVVSGLEENDRIIIYSKEELKPGSRIRVVDTLRDGKSD